MKRRSITLRGAAANGFIAASYSDSDLAEAFEKTCGPARAAIVRQIVARCVRVSGVCVKCGCTDDDCRGCIERTGHPCNWHNIEHTLCTACVEDVR